MKGLKKMNIVIIILLTSVKIIAQNRETVTFLSADKIKITADLYLSKKKTAPFIILYHQARYSRGEYIETASKFNELGYHCLAVDLRSGGEVNDIVNATHQEAEKKGLATNYASSLPDMEAAIAYIQKKYPDNDVLLLGSSYSASLVLVLATKYANIIGAMAFSPGEYFKLNGQTFKSFAPKVKCPVFITSAKKEINMWKPIYEALPRVFAFKFEPEKIEGLHGSKNLWNTSPDHSYYWQELKRFLGNL